MINSLPYFVKLHEIYFFILFGNNCTDEIFKSISLCSNLKSIALREVQDYSSDNLIKSVSLSKNIEFIKFSSREKGVLTENLFSFISSTLLKLKSLDISYSGEGITDFDIESLSNLPNLEELNIGYNNRITGSVLVKLPNLKKLHCYYCNDLEDDSLISFLRCAANLELLDICDRKKIRTSVINVAIEITKKRTNDLILEIRIKENQIDFKKIIDKSSLLHLNTNHVVYYYF